MACDVVSSLLLSYTWTQSSSGAGSDVIRDLRTVGCVATDTTEAMVRIDAVNPDENVEESGDWAVTPIPGGGEEDTGQNADDVDPGPQMLGTFSLGSVPKEGVAYACRYSGEEAIKVLVGPGDAQPDLCVPLQPGTTVSLG